MVKIGVMKEDGKLYYVESTGMGSFAITELIDVELQMEGKSGQLIESLNTVPFGRCLYMDHKIEFSLRDEFIYHEVLVHPAMLTHPNPRNILIIGGGDGGALREVLKHPSVERVDLVELDPDIVDLVKRVFPELPAGSFDDRRLNLVFSEGRKFVENSRDESYDVAIMDLTDPKGPSVRLYTKEFYSEVSRILRDDGIMVTHSEGIYYTPDAVLRIFSAVKANFRIARLARTYVPSFRDEWTFSIGSKLYDPLEADVENEMKKRGIKTRFYSALIHRAAFAMGSSMEEIALKAKPNEDSDPVEVE
ncbi:MAG: polyamine aminopropyltransferase [Candidatus Methanodesulfokora sp.]